MPLHFQSIRSGSSGNCLLLWTEHTRLLIDAGFPSMRKCRAALADLGGDIDAILVSHLHHDHIQYATLRVAEELALPVYVYRADVGHLIERHFRRWPFEALEIRPYTPERFRIGDLGILPFELPHHPEHTTFGFEVTYAQDGQAAKAVLASDLSGWQDIRDRFRGADFLYVEANHDEELLRVHPNFNSRYHLSNVSCGCLLRQAFECSRALPTAVMLGHLSKIRNRPDLATHTVATILDEAGYDAIDLHVAPRYLPSDIIRIA